MCYNDACPKAGECLRHRVYTLAPATERQHLCVLPQAWQDGACTEFAENRPQRLAWGMKHLFDGIPMWKATAIRHELMEIFGSEATFYRYRRGEYLVTPQLQAKIADLFAHYGYTSPRHYDRTVQAFYFPSPGFGTLHSNTTERTKKRHARLS